MSRTPAVDPDAASDADRVDRLNDALTRIYYAAKRGYGADLSHRAIRVLQLTAMAAAAPCVHDVARGLGMAVSSASELLKRMERKGLIERRRMSSDERVVEISLTPAGEAALTEHTTLDPAKLAAALADLTPAEQETLTALVERLARTG